MQLLTIIALTLLLAGCDHMEEDAHTVQAQAEKDAGQVSDNVEKKLNRMASDLRDNIKRTNNKIRDWWLTPLPEEEARAIPPTYCYSALQDILCYRQPMPGWEHRLVAFQGTTAVPPPPSVTRLMAKRKPDPDMKPVARAAKAKPVFSSIPKPPEEPVVGPNGELPPASVADPANQQLPNPLTTPQL